MISLVVHVVRNRRALAGCLRALAGRSSPSSPSFASVFLTWVSVLLDLSRWTGILLAGPSGSGTGSSGLWEPDRPVETGSSGLWEPDRPVGTGSSG